MSHLNMEASSKLSWIAALGLAIVLSAPSALVAQISDVEAGWHTVSGEVRSLEIDWDDAQKEMARLQADLAAAEQAYRSCDARPAGHPGKALVVRAEGDKVKLERARRLVEKRRLELQAVQRDIEQTREGLEKKYKRSRGAAYRSDLQRLTAKYRTDYVQPMRVEILTAYKAYRDGFTSYINVAGAAAASCVKGTSFSEELLSKLAGYADVMQRALQFK